MSTSETFRCSGCETEYRVTAASRATVICQECDQIATLYGDAAALREYRLGYTKYREARRRLSEAMATLETGSSTLARGGFNDAASEFEQSVDHFWTAQREAERDTIDVTATAARQKATCLWQAAEWLSGFTFASEQGDQTRAATYRHDAKRRLTTASEYDTLTPPAELQSAME